MGLETANQGTLIIQKWANPGLFLSIFVFLHIPIQMTNIQFEQYNYYLLIIYYASLKFVNDIGCRRAIWRSKIIKNNQILPN